MALNENRLLMFGSRKITMPRRLAWHFVLWWGASLAWVAVVSVHDGHRAAVARVEAASLERLRQTAAEVTPRLSPADPPRLQAALRRLGAERQLRYCAVVLEDGRVLAGWPAGVLAENYAEPAGAHALVAGAERVRIRQPRGALLEYRIPLWKNGEEIARLHGAVEEPPLWETTLAAGLLSPAAACGPLVCLGLGLLAIGRTVRPVRAIEQQLGEVALAVDPQAVALEPIRARGAAALGWNRLIAWRERAAVEPPDSPDVALRAALEGVGEVALDGLPDGIAITDREGRIARANPALAAILARGNDGAAALVGERMEGLLALDRQASAAALLDRTARGRAVTAEIQGPRAADERVLRVGRYPLIEARGPASAGHVWSVRDVTQQQLAARTRDSFLEMASHELRTPLANIKAYAETLTLAEHRDLDMQREFLNIINAEATRLGRLIEDLLSISSMEAGALSLARQETDVRRLFEEALGKVRPIMDAKGVAFQAALPEKWPAMHLDKEKFTAVLVNVLGNAAKYTEPGGSVTLRVTADERWLNVVVDDTGIGISADDMSRLFTKFFRSGDPRVQREPGSGLGLSLVREIVRLHGGTIDLQSEPDQGTHVTIALPVG